VVAESFEERMRRGGAGAVAEATGFFMRDDPVHETLRAIAVTLQQHGVPYAVAGGMALVVHGYDRTTVDVDVLVTPEGLETIHKIFRDAEHGVRVEFLVSGEFPGDGRPKPVAFPDPAACSIEVGGIRYLNLNALLELKLASGLTNPGRLKDLSDVQEMIRTRDLPLELGSELHPYVREKYRELWQATRSG